MTTTAPERPLLSFAEAQEAIGIRLNELLSSYPDSGIEARRRITCDLHFEPRPEELQMIARIAGDETKEGPRREVPRALLVLRVIADRELKRLYEMPALERDVIEHLAEVVPEIAREARRLVTLLSEVVVQDDLFQHDREYLMQIGDAFEVSRDELVAASVMAQELARVVRAVADGALEEATPSLAPEEREAIAACATRAAVDAGEPVRDDPSSRARIDALVLRAHVDGLLVRWNALGNPSEDDPERREQRDRLLEDLRQARMAVTAIGSRIQDRQDTALVAGLSGFAEELRRAARDLFSSKLKLAPVLRAPYEDPASRPDDEAFQARLEETLAAQEGVSKPQREQSPEEIYLGALKEMRAPKAPRPIPAGSRAARKQRERRRMVTLSLVAGVLAVASAIVNFVILPPAGKALTPPTVADLAPVVDAIQVKAAGPVVFTQVDDWKGLGAQDRRQQIGRLGDSVAGDGFSTVIVIDEFGDAAGVWTPASGSALVE